MSRPLPNNFHRPCQPPPPHKPSRRNTIGGSALAPTRHPVGYHAQKRLDARFKDPEEERRKFTEAAGRSRREKAALEAERLKLLEEKRSWEVEQMLAELPPTPAAVGSSSLQVRALSPVKAPNASPKRSTRKFRAKGVIPRKTRVSQVVFQPWRSRSVTKNQEQGSTGLPEFKTRIAVPSPPPSPHLTNAFVLPPPSPAAAFDSVRTPLPPLPPLPKFEMLPPAQDSSDDSVDVPLDSIPSGPSASSSLVPPPAVPSTPSLDHSPWRSPSLNG
ncbi:hypothetical protein L226DRAFT_573053 [Lentinus tigrinus ALCF2SS1-7]|uniref:uncharacterized protein n=1 Tax=Lentinus tigrinus ALCF2SS1-7 TaxID=1328758 RepID=UPI0011663DB6|nr:hypothetical protein L226DRAFT_573053 [Lentinus tigrinus ALCF2SS1-7]